MPVTLLKRLHGEVGALCRSKEEHTRDISDLAARLEAQWEKIERRLSKLGYRDVPSSKVDELGSRISKLETYLEELQPLECLDKLYMKHKDLAEAHKYLSLRVDLVEGSVEQLEA